MCIFWKLNKGKGLEIILKASKLNKKINFHVYGDLKIMFSDIEKVHLKM